MRRRTQMLALGAAMMIASAAAACGQKTEPETTAATTATEAVTETDTEAEVTEPDTDVSEEQTVTGEIVAAGMSSITIKAEDGSEESYLKEDTKVEMEGDQVEGTKVTITYVERDGMKYALTITDAQ